MSGTSPTEHSTFVRDRGPLPSQVVSAVGYESSELAPSVHRGLPSPSLTFVFSLDGPIVTGHSPEHATSSRAYRNHIIIGGLHTRPAYIAQPEVQAGVEAWKWIARHRGAGTMDGLARHVLLSPRQLTTLFDAEFGITPKALSRLMRFEHARQQIARTVASGCQLDLAATATESGYYDHSHLVRDFQQYVGTSPSQWISEERRNIQAGGQHIGEDLQA